ncbi:MAG: rhamnulokinase family protein [Acidobacteriota bacterium]
MRPAQFLAADFGAGSGRVMLGTLVDGRLHLDELHRFPNHQIRILGRIHWDLYELYRRLLEGLSRAVKRGIERVEGIGVDTWGVDYGLVDADGFLLDQPVCYRDSRTDGVMEDVFRRIPRERIYEVTGIQFLQLNTLFQLCAAQRQSPASLAAAQRLLFMPDLFNYLLTGEAVTEPTIASTSQMFDARRRTWAIDLLESLGLPTRILPQILPTGTRLGRLRSDVREETGLEADVILAAGHDTACAVLAVPARGENWAYLSSGTWSLLGVECEEPVISPASAAHNFTNEAGYGGSVRFLKNIMGMWLLERCKAAWEAEDNRELTYADLVEAAQSAPALRTVFDPDDPSLMNPPHMPEAIARLCRRGGQPVPEGRAEMVRAVFESLALKYRQVLDQITTLQNRRPEVLHIVGGGSRNDFLNQLTADATGLTVVAGPAEATATGNILVQALSSGHLPSIEAARQLVRDSFALRMFEPKAREGWDAKYEEFLAVVGS